MSSTVYSRLAIMLAGQEKPHNAAVVLAFARARDVDGLTVYLKQLGEENV